MHPDPPAENDLSRSADDATPTPASDFLVVGLGASAGGIAALQSFFRQVPADSGMAFVVILHLSPEYVSQLAEVLQQATTMPVLQVTEAVPIECDRVYVIPPAQRLRLVNATLQLSEPGDTQGQRAPIDLFFRSLAESQGPRAAAVVLSGAGADGTSGVKQVKERGGLVLVQDPNEAEYDMMPRHAVNTGLADVVLPVAELPGTLVAYWRQAQAPAPPAAPPTGEGDEVALRELLATLQIRTGHDFSQYKRPTLLRRIGRRMQVTGATTLAAYLALLRARPEEGPPLLRDLLISVTNFFRDPPAWQALEAALPLLFAGKGDGDTVRAWVAGCATGEEAYSVAMLLAEHAAALQQRPSIQVFATDIDGHAIGVARAGVYPETIAVDVSPERLQRFFTAEPGHYRVRKELRDLVLFAPHNILGDPPFSHLDLITCRNLLIYMERALQERVLQLFHFTLLPDRLLLLGSSESTDGVANLFAPLDKTQRLFQRRSVPSTVQVVPALPLATPRGRQAGHRAPADSSFVPSFDELASRGLAQYAPPGVIVNQDDDIVHLARGAGRFLQFADGLPSSSLLRALHPELRLELRSALYQARQEGRRVETRRVRLQLGPSVRQVIAGVQPLAEPDWAQGYALIFFYDLPDSSEITAGAPSDAEPLVRQLEEELQRTREQLRTTTEQYETALEEHRAGHEGLQAINEELRAASEELETSKEELHATNEELLTVNHELKQKVDELSRTTSDLQNLMASTAIGTIFVDRELRIKRYTPSAQAIVNLLPSDLNRPLGHITHTLADDQLIADAARVLTTLTPVEREVAAQDGSWYLLRIQPYRTESDQIDGVVLTFVDITRRRATEQALRASEERLRLLIESVEDYAIITYTLDNRVASWNVGAERIFGYGEAEILGQDGAIIFTPEERAAGVPTHELSTAVERGKAEDERWHVRKDGSRFYASGVMTPMRDATIRGFVKVLRDLTERKQAEEALRRSEETLQLITDGVPVLIGYHDRDERYRFVNAAFPAFFGVPREQILGRTLREQVGERVYARLQPGIQAALRGETVRFEDFEPDRHGSGKPGWTEEHYIPRFTPDGDVEGFFVLAIDITERKRAEQMLRASEARQAFLLALGDALRDLADPIAIQERASQVLGQHLGVSRVHYGEVTDDAHILFGRHYTDGVPVAMNRIRIDDLGPSVVAALRAGQTIVMPDVAASPELSAAEQLANAAAGIGAQVGVPLVKGGRLVAVFAVHQAAPRAWSDDEVGLIEETAQRTWAAVERARAEAALRESEARFRTVTDAVPQLIWTNDADGRATYFNQRWYAYSGLSEEQSVGPGWQAIVHPDDAPASVEHWRQVLAAGAPFETEYRLRRADGAFRWHLGRNVPLHDAGGQIIGWFGSATDIEELKQAEAAQRESAVLRQLAAAQEEERLRIARDLHDQLGQQITGLLLGLKRVEQAAAGTPIATMLSPLQELADELAREVHQLAVNLRPTALEDIGLVPALERLVTSWSAETAVPAAFERIGLGRGRLPRQVEVALFRVAQEALTNVRKHAEASRVGVIIERRGDQAVLVVEDDGRGFDVDKPAPDRGRPPLGLVGMRERVGQVGGTLEIEASPGRGTSVLVRIPLDTRPDSQ